VYTKEEASLVRQKFWTKFGKYMQPVPSATGEDVHWINYKTGIKGIAFKMNADNNRAIVEIEIALKDEQLQHKYFHIFKMYEKEFDKMAANNWSFEKNFTDGYGKNFSYIFTQISPINIFRETDWPTIISFLKTNIMALDVFWADYKVAFELV
jgi:hypothetical protein